MSRLRLLLLNMYDSWRDWLPPGSGIAGRKSRGTAEIIHSNPWWSWKLFGRKHL